MILDKLVFQGTQDDLVRFKCDYIHKTLSLMSDTVLANIISSLFWFVPCLACPEFIIKMKHETTLRD